MHSFSSTRFKPLSVVSGKPRCSAHALAEQHISLIVRVMTRRFPSVIADPERAGDAFTLAFLYLLRAAERYDPGQGAPFAAYAARYIEGACLRFLSQERSASRLPVVFSLDEPCGEHLENTRHELVADLRAEVPGRSLTRRHGFNLLIKRLPERQQWVLTAYYHFGWTETEIAGALGLTKQRVGAIKAQALKALRADLTRELV